MTVDDEIPHRATEPPRLPYVDLRRADREASSPVSADGESFCSRSDMRSVVDKLANRENENPG